MIRGSTAVACLQGAGRRVPHFGSVGGGTAAAQIAIIDGDILARGNFIQAQVNSWIVGKDERTVGLSAVGIGAILVMRLYLRGREFSWVPGEFVDSPNPGVSIPIIPAGVGVVVSSQRHGRL